MSQKQNSNYTEEEVSLKELIYKIKNWCQFLISKWKTILIAGIIGGILGISYTIIKKPTYTAETTFVLEEGESGGGLGQYAGLASIVGIDIGGGGGGIFKGDNILELYKSRRMIVETLLSKDTFNNKQQLLIERYIYFNELRKKWAQKPELNNIKFDPKYKLTRIQDSILNKLVETINKDILQVLKPDKKLSIISVKVNSTDELFAKSFTNTIVEKVNNFYVKTKTKKSSENLAILQNQADSVKRILNSSIGGVAAALDANPNINPVYQTLRVPSQKKQLDVQASAAVYQEILKNLELAKINFRNDKPLIQVIDKPVLPLKSSKVNSFILVILFGFSGCIISIGILILKRFFYNIFKN